MLGKLSWAAIPLDQPIPLFAAAVVGVVIFGVLVLVTLKGPRQPAIARREDRATVGRQRQTALAPQYFGASPVIRELDRGSRLFQCVGVADADQGHVVRP